MAKPPIYRAPHLGSLGGLSPPAKAIRHKNL
jgi:hypothetical protein